MKKRNHFVTPRSGFWFFLLSLCSPSVSESSPSLPTLPHTVLRAAEGTDALLPCPHSVSTRYSSDGVLSENPDGSSIGWRFSAKKLDKILGNGSLLVESVSKEDAGNYTCFLDEDRGSKKAGGSGVVQLVVVSRPLPVRRVEARALSTYATISWGNPLGTDVDGYRISYAVSSGNSDEVDWIQPSYLRSISASSEIIDIYNLHPNTPYVVRVESFNLAGASRPVTVHFHTPANNRGPNSRGKHPLRFDRLDEYHFVWMFTAGAVLGAIFLAIFIPLLTARYRKIRRNVPVRRESRHADDKNTNETIELIPNIVVNPQFGEAEAAQKISVAEQI